MDSCAPDQLMPLRRRSGKAVDQPPPHHSFFLSLFLFISLFLERYKILLSHLILMLNFNLITIFVILLFVELMTAVLRGRSMIALIRRRRMAAPMMISLPDSDPMISLPVPDPSSVPARMVLKMDLEETELEEDDLSESEFEEEDLYSFTIISTKYDYPYGYCQDEIDQEIMEELFMGLGVGSVIRSVDSRLFVYTVSLPDLGLVIVHRDLIGMSTVETDFDFRYIIASLYDFGPQLMFDDNLFSAPSSIMEASDDTEISSVVEVCDSVSMDFSDVSDSDESSSDSDTSSSDSDTSTPNSDLDRSSSDSIRVNSDSDRSSSDSNTSTPNSDLDMSNSDSDRSSSDSDRSNSDSERSITDSSMDKKALRRSSRLAEKEYRPVYGAKLRRGASCSAEKKVNGLVQEPRLRKSACLVEKKDQGPVEEVKPRRSSRLAEKAGKARMMI